MRLSFVVKNADHWVYANAGVQEGDTIHDLIGWEYHGYPVKEDSSLVILSENTLDPNKFTDPEGPNHAAVIYMTNERSFVFNAEKFIIESLKELNIECYRREKLIGIWTKNKKKEHAKIASLGLRVTRGIIYHGVSINVNCELNNFYNIIPCGILNSKVTSVSEMIGKINNYKIDNIFKKNLKIILNN